MAKYKTKFERDYMSRVADLGCICCGQPAELHHPRKHTGLGLRSSHFDVIPLCPNHHRLGKVSIHLGKTQFERAFGTEKELLKKVKKGLIEKEKMESFLTDLANNTPNEDQFK
tara:strand:- start:727 stop:1065 length:339 start_codon:yes stop_codon:yes gene_type:complete